MLRRSSLPIRLSLLVVSLGSCSARAAHAQPATGDDDLELPSTAASAPPAVLSPPVAAPAPASAPVPPPASNTAQLAAARETDVDAIRTPAPDPSGAGASEAPSSPSAGILVSGYLQAQFQHNALSTDQLAQGGDPLNQNEFLLRRGRLRADRAWDFAWATLELDVNTVRGPGVSVRRAEASLLYRGSNGPALPPLVMLTLGVTDLPFGYELNESAQARAFMERSTGSGALFPTEMDVGAKLSGAYRFLRYALAASNGEPVDGKSLPRDPNSRKDVTARFGAQGRLGSSLDLGGGTSFAVGKGFHKGSDATKSRVEWRDDNEDGAIQPAELLGVPGSTATPSANFERWAIGLDLELELRTSVGRSKLYGEAFVASNYDRAIAVADPVTTGNDLREAGGYVALTQELWGYGLVGFRAAFYDPNSDLTEVRAGRSLPKTQTIQTYSPLVGLALPERARLTFQYDFVRDYLARDVVGVPTDADNDQWIVRLQVNL